MSSSVFDIVILTDDRYVSPKNTDWYINNILTEDGLVQRALEKRGLKVGRKSWSDPNFDWTSTPYVLFRSTWDYFDRAGEWKAWLASTAQKTQMINAFALVQWNMDKHYLQDLMDRGVNVPTLRYIEVGESVRLADLVAEMKEEAVILKPCFSAASRHTYKIAGGVSDELEEIFQQLIQEEAMMLQPFQHSVPQKGEVSMMIMGGKFTHAVLKKPKAGDFRVQDDFGGTVELYEPSNAEIDFAEQVVAACPAAPLYARVDMIEDNAGDLAVIEMELIEPELWFRLKPEAAEILADHLVQGNTL